MGSRKYLKYSFIFVSFLLFSCRLSLEEKKCTGIWKQNGSHIKTTLTIKKNGRYAFEEREFGDPDISYGKWYLKNDTLILIQKRHSKIYDEDEKGKNQRNILFKKMLLMYCNLDLKGDLKENCLAKIEYGRTYPTFYKPGFKERRLF